MPLNSPLTVSVPKGSVQVRCVPAHCIVLALLDFTCVCQSNPFDSHVCVCVPAPCASCYASCNVLCLQRHQQKWIWAPVCSYLPPHYLLLLGQPACPHRAEGGACTASSGGRVLDIPIKCVSKRKRCVLALSACAYVCVWVYMCKLVRVNMCICECVYQCDTSHHCNDLWPGVSHWCTKPMFLF